MGVPSFIHSDLGTEFKSHLVQELCEILEIEHTFCPTDQHSSNLAERVIQQINNFFRILNKEKQKLWSSFLPFFQMASNAHLNLNLGMSGFPALTGRAMTMPISIAIASTPQGEEILPVKIIIDAIIREIFLNKQK